MVIGSVHLCGDGSEAAPDGLAGRVAVGAAASGAGVELIAKVGDDPAGDALLLALARAGVGHVAVLRDAAHPTARRAAAEDSAIDDGEPAVAWTVALSRAPVLDAADVGLALRYLTDYRVIVVVHPAPGVVAEAITAAVWAGAHLVLVDHPDDAPPGDLPPGSLVLGVTDGPDDGSAIGARLGAYAAAVDRGQDPAAAFAGLTADGGVA